MSVEYYCEGDEMYELLGIYGKSIDEATTIDQNDLKIQDEVISLKLIAKHKNDLAISKASSDFQISPNKINQNNQ